MATTRPPCDLGALQRVLDALYQPVWVVAGPGRIVQENTAARAAPAEVVESVRSSTAEDFDDPRFAVLRVAIDTAVLSLVIAHSVGPSARLPPSLARVASLVARGMSDKDIAGRLDVPLSTVRTYVRRIYARLGVRSRVELSRRWTRR